MQISYEWQCAAIHDPQCGEAGFSIIHNDGRVLKNLTRNTVDWYNPDIDLGPEFGIIDNPVFAAYTGALWKDSDVNSTYHKTSATAESAKDGSVSASSNFNETENVKWQKKRSCAKRYMNGPSGLYPSCSITMETGREKLKNLGRVQVYYGNSSLVVNSQNEFSVAGNFLNEGAYNNFEPLLWEAFRSYEMQYKNRNVGLKYKGNETLSIFIGDEMIQFEAKNVEEWDGKNPTKLKWPTVYKNPRKQLKNSIEIKLLRYEVDEEAWNFNGNLSYLAETDFYGMPINVPKGMSSTRAQSGERASVIDFFFFLLLPKLRSATNC